jgi:hypothetical protein
MSTQTTNNKQGANAGGAFSLLTMIYWFQTGKLATAFSPESSFTDSLLTLLSSYTEWQAWVFIIIFGLILLIVMGLFTGLGVAAVMADGKISAIEWILIAVFTIVIMPIYVLLANWSLVTFLL